MISMVIAAMLQATAALVTVAQGSNSQIMEPREVVIRSTAEWQTLWREHSFSAPPIVDFSDSTVVGVFLGTRPTAGYRVDVVTIKVEGDSTVVEYSERGPAPGVLLAQVLTSPFHLVRYPRKLGAIRFRKVDPPA